MCAQDGAPGSVAQALRMAHAGMDYLNSPAAADLPAAACGQALIALGEIQAKHAAAYARLLRRFDALDGHDTDGYGTSSAWLAAMSKLTGPVSWRICRTAAFASLGASLAIAASHAADVPYP